MAILLFSLRSLMAIGLIWQFAVSSWAQDYPVKPVRCIVPSTGNTELVGRLIAGGLTQTFGHQFYVDIRAGAAGNIGAEIAARAPADGYTVLLIMQSHAVNVSLYRKLSYDLMADFAAVTQLASAPQTVVVHPSLPVKSISDLVKLAKAKPGVINYASAGRGTSSSLAGEFFKMTAGVDLVEIPYKGGGPALTAVFAGEVSVYFAPLASALPYVQQGKLRLLAVSTSKRLSMLPEVPTVVEAGYPDYEASNWYGLVMPAKTPKDKIATIWKAAVAVLNRPDISKRMSETGFTTVGSRPEEFTAFIKSDIEKWRTVVRRTGIYAD